jgi:hypothetical protein
VAERLGTGLQNRLLRFESGRDLSFKSYLIVNQQGSFFLSPLFPQTFKKWLFSARKKRLIT